MPATPQRIWAAIRAAHSASEDARERADAGEASGQRGH